MVEEGYYIIQRTDGVQFEVEYRYGRKSIVDSRGQFMQQPRPRDTTAVNHDKQSKYLLDALNQSVWIPPRVLPIKRATIFDRLSTRACIYQANYFLLSSTQYLTIALFVLILYVHSLHLFLDCSWIYYLTTTLYKV